MATAADVMKGGFSAGQAKALNGQTNLTVSAAGTTSATATTLTASNNLITTCGSGAGVILPAAEINDEIWVWNGTGTNTLSVYPDSGSTINQLAADVPGNVPPYGGAIFRKVSKTAWWVNLSA